MRKSTGGTLTYSPSDLIRYLASPFASWMDRYYLEFPGELTPDAETEEQQLIADARMDRMRPFSVADATARHDACRAHTRVPGSQA